jgi:hypothetical protein
MGGGEGLKSSAIQHRTPEIGSELMEVLEG